jgi:hypothetical protein
MGYTGARVSIPMGELGFTNIQNMSKTPIQGAIQAEGLEFVEGSVQREPGNILYVTMPNPNITITQTAIEFYPTPNVRRLFMWGWEQTTVGVTVTNVGHIWKWSGTGAAVSIKSGLGANAGKFVAAGAESLFRAKKLFFFNNADPVQVITGDSDTVTTLSKPAADWNAPYYHPTFGVLHRNCMWAGGNTNDPHRIYKSTAADHEDFTTNSYSISVFPGEGDVLSGGYSFNGRLFLFKRPRGIYWVDDTSINPNDWGVKKLVDTVGLVNPNALCETEQDLVFFDWSIGLYSLGTVQELGDVKPRSLLDEFGVDRALKDNILQGPTLETLDWVLKAGTTLVWHNEKRQLILTTYKSTGGSSGFIKLVLDYRFSPMKISYSFRDGVLMSAMATDSANKQKHIFGYVGNVYMGDQENRSCASIGGAAWPSKYQIPHTNLGFADPNLVGERIALEWLTIETTIFTEQQILVDVFLDGVFKYTLLFDFPKTLEGFILDTDHLDVNALGGSATFTRTKRLRGTCERFSFVFYSNHASANFIINDVQVSFRGNEKRLRQRP